MSTEAAVSFDHINLNTIDPNSMKAPIGVPMKFIVTSAERKSYSNDNGEGKYTTFKFTVTDNETFSGRSFYTSLFDDKAGSKNPSARQLRILMDATGVPQTEGTEFSDWLAELVAQRAEFSAPLKSYTTKKGEVKTEPDIFKALPA